MGVGAYLSLIGRRRTRRGGGGGLLTFSAFRMGTYSRWVLIQGWALIRINTVSGLTFAINRHSYYLLYLAIKQEAVFPLM